MRRLWPNLEGEDGLETVLEVPLPDEMFASNSLSLPLPSWRTIKSWLSKPHHPRGRRSSQLQTHIHFLLPLIGAPFTPLPISSHLIPNIKPHPIERSMALYIVRQYIAAAGGQHAVNAIESMCVIGKVKMVGGEDLSLRVPKMKSMKQGAGELGGFVLWQKRPHLWSLELMLSGFKITAGSDGAVAWRQTPSSRASRGPARPLRRSLQGLDPRATADLFSNSICIGEKTINGEDCFVLKLEAEARNSSSSVEIMKHTVLGSFSQRTGLLVHLGDCHSLRTKSSPTNQLLWETRIESLIQDYRTIDGVNIAHAGRTTVLSSRYGDDLENQSRTRTRMEEVWSIEEVDFNVKGLSTDCFLPPADLNKEDQECDCDAADNGGLGYKASTKICGSRGGTKVVAIDEESLEVYASDDDDEL